jgi:hypothetical protein
VIGERTSCDRSFKSDLKSALKEQRLSRDATRAAGAAFATFPVFRERRG